MPETIQLLGLGLDFKPLDEGAKKSESILDRLERKVDVLSNHVATANRLLRFDQALQGERNLSAVERRTQTAGRTSQQLAREIGSVGRAYQVAASVAQSSLSGMGGGLNRLIGLVSQVRGGVGGFLAGGGSLALGAAGLAGGGIVAALGGLAYGYKKVLDVGIPFNDLLERTRIQFRTLLRGTGQDVDEYIQTLFKLTDETEFNFPQIASLAAQLKAAKFEAREIPGVIRSVADAVAAVGGGSEGLDRILLALRQIKGSARVSAEELNQLLDANVPVFDIIQKRTGLRSDQFRKLAEDNKIDAEVFVKYLLEGFDQEFGGAQKEIANKTVDGLLSSFSDAFDRRASEASVNASATFRKLIQTGLAGLQSGTASDLAKGVNDFTGTITGPLDKFLEGVAKGNYAEAGKGLVNDVVTGVTNTAREKALDLLESGKALGGNLLDGAKKILGIQSPSREFENIGRNIGLGLIDGVDSIESDVIARVDELMDRVLMAGKRGLRPGESREYTQEQLRARVEQYVDDPRVRAFLDTIASAEGANYNTLFGGGRFSSFAAHPNQRITKMLGGRPITSTAAGRYQFLSRTWNGVADFLGLPDFSPRNQDIAAVELLRRRGVLDDILRGYIAGALTGANREWASLPGSPYGQPTRSASVLIEKYNASLERLSGILERYAAPLTKIADNLSASSLAMQREGGRVIYGGEIITQVPGRKFDPLPLNLDRIGALLDDSKLRAAEDALTKAKAKLDELTKPKETQKQARENLMKKAEEESAREYYGKALKATFRDFAQSAITDIGSIKEAASRAFQTIATTIIDRMTERLTDKLFKRFIDPLLDKIFGGSSSGSGGSSGGGWVDTAANWITKFLGGLFGKRAEGGPINALTPYLVGERGPEIVVPRMSGYVVPNHAIPQMMTGNVQPNVTYNQTFNVIIQAQDYNSFRNSEVQIARRMADMLRNGQRFE
jgi:tape measure domain-containing protein